jgi:diacylglycerol kinase (ATP)
LLIKLLAQVIAFLNTGSGGGEAEAVQKSFSELLGAEFVYDLNRCTPESILIEYAFDPYVRVLACGGDGTMGWVESATDHVWDDLLDQQPLHETPYALHLPLAIMPLGTGNDLSRTLGWGSEYKPYMKSMKMLQQVVHADIVQLDRWRCVIVPEEQVDEATKEAIPMMLSQRMKRETSETLLATTPPNFLSGTRAPNNNNVVTDGAVFDGVFCNYFGIGIESEIALAFHSARAAHPEKFTSPFTNKLVYVKKGLAHLNGPVLRGRVRMVVSQNGSDYTELDIPKSCRSIILLNIDSYAAGTKLAKSGHHDDKLIEVIFCPGLARLGLARAGAKMKPAATVDRVLIKTIDDVPCQVDGEPWHQPPSMISIRLECQRPVLKPHTTKSNFFSCQSTSSAV